MNISISLSIIFAPINFKHIQTYQLESVFIFSFLPSYTGGGSVKQAVLFTREMVKLYLFFIFIVEVQKALWYMLGVGFLLGGGRWSEPLTGINDAGMLCVGAAYIQSDLQFIYRSVSKFPD